ncbi:MAG: RluA family pseudouridine synthase [Spirochaetaceae bacterium]|jgi:23S rRNA pseudouridine1911/1915/1917 synthase|nr:RluA family pseudouridine synthase [Spirochaetaceae bacterium]
MENLHYSGVVEILDGTIRLDRYAAEHLRILSRSQIKNRLLDARVNGRAVKISRLLRSGDTLELSWLPQAPVCLEPENIPLKILYEDRRCVVINKEQGMVVHPGAGNPSGTLANALLWRKLLHSGGTKAVEAGVRSGIVHRLDKDTSGVIIAAYDDEALAMLSAQFKARRVKKRYAALVQGRLREERGRICTRLVRDPRDRRRFTALAGSSPVERAHAAADAPPAGREKKLPGKGALTYYRVLKSWGDYSLVLLMPRTGRTHQLRVHLKYLGHPILGDPIYGRKDRSFPGVPLLLHARSLTILLPESSGPSCFKAPLPEYFTRTMGTLMHHG